MAIATATALALGLGAAGVGSSLFGGASARGANKRAAGQQAEAGYDASKWMWDKVIDENPRIEEAANNAGRGVEESANNAGEAVLNAAHDADRRVTQSAQDANGYLHPYVNSGATATGTLDGVLSPDGRYTSMMDEKFTFDKDQDPAYQFVLEQGMKAIEKSAAARGGLQGGGTLKALAKFAGGVASGEYAKQFDRFQTDRNNRGTILNNYSNQLQSTADRGFRAGTVSGDNLMDAATYGGNVGMQAEQYAGDARTRAAGYAGDIRYNAVQHTTNNAINAARYQGDNRMGVGNAQAASTINGNQAFWNGVNGAVNAGANAYMLGSSLRPSRPTVGGTGDSASVLKPGEFGATSYRGRTITPGREVIYG